MFEIFLPLLPTPRFSHRAEVGTIFALSWLITWFGHVLSDFRHVVRLYDFFLACHPLMPIYFAAVVGAVRMRSARQTQPSCGLNNRIGHIKELS